MIAIDNENINKINVSKLNIVKTQNLEQSCQTYLFNMSNLLPSQNTNLGRSNEFSRHFEV